MGGKGKSNTARASSCARQQNSVACWWKELKLGIEGEVCNQGEERCSTEGEAKRRCRYGVGFESAGADSGWVLTQRWSSGARKKKEG
mmetsp:Transcript_15033/g.25741  ORF Transcript_15033/g.25741 Transcript_15033/m.25741 type:complete len:87 (-) Transcript_15033:2251-2511(-)